VQLWLAYSLDHPGDKEACDQALDRVDRHYRPVLGPDLIRQGWADSQLGAVVWDVSEPSCRWPSWAERRETGVFSGYPVYGARKVLGGDSRSPEPVALTLRLRERPELLGELPPPFVLGLYDRRDQELALIVDGAGYGRAYELRFERGWVWSNRVGALPLFAGIAPTPNLGGWRTHAGSGWFMGTTTPLAGVEALRPGSFLRAGPHRERRLETVDAVREWVAPRPQPADLDPAESALTDMVRACSQLWETPPRVHLSGGRDTRVVAAAAVAAHADATFWTNASLPGELAVARELVKRAPRPLNHETAETGDVTATGNLSERAMRLHHIFDGIYGHSGLRGRLLAGMPATRRATLTGAGGEIARGSFYRGSVHDLVEGWGPEGPYRRLSGLYRVHGGVIEATHQEVDRWIAVTLEEGAGRGLRGHSLLDWFYLAERLRRWANGSARAGSVSPLIEPLFIRAAFDIPPRDRIDDVLHERTSARLVPEWAGVGYYKASREDFRGQSRPRIWETSDAEAVRTLVAEADRWADTFDPAELASLWADVEAGRGETRHESVFERLAWRAFYDDHLRRLAQAATAPPPRPAIATREAS
jgi:hypothetical protein